MEYSPEKAGVGGSIPALATILLFFAEPLHLVLHPLHTKMITSRI